MKDKKFKDEEGSAETKSCLIGTAEYISPEMIREGNCGIAADLWALGKLLNDC
jgi:serine/threonine protein kinase